MRILISGVCGFAGSALARALIANGGGRQIVGFDNFIRPGSETNREALRKLGVKLIHADARSASDVEALPACDWVLDAAANPSVLAGTDGRTSSRQLVEHNLGGTVNLLEYCRRHAAGLVLLSTSRVYGISPLAALGVDVVDKAFRPRAPFAPGLSEAGIEETFPTGAPVSLYGATKLASEALALEYGETFGLPVFVNRCGVLAGAGQFGRADQGIFAFWINSHLRRRPLQYIGFGGKGHQVRDCLHPRDLAAARKAVCRASGRLRRQDCERWGRSRLGDLSAPAQRVVRSQVRPPPGGLQSRAPRLRPSVDRARLGKGGPALGLAAANAGFRDFRGDCIPRARSPRLARAFRTPLSGGPVRRRIGCPPPRECRNPPSFSP